MTKKFLYEKITERFGEQTISSMQVPYCIQDNLCSRFEIRTYQQEAFARFILYFEKEFPGKEKPLHLLFNMATGSGKTLIMAGLILYLYKKGYRNFLFFVNSTNIIEKTKANFLNPASSKYLFGDKIMFDSGQVEIAHVNNFEGVNDNGINICFTTIQGLHTDLNCVRENSLTYDDFDSKKVVLLADEAHHLNARTKEERTKKEKSWENTVEKILKKRSDNLLLEFTATHDYAKPAMKDKYHNKVINRYDLVDFCKDGFSKKVFLIGSDLELRERLLQAIIISQYRQMVAAKHKILLKPVVLFKAQRTKEQSRETKEIFHKLIDKLDKKSIEAIKKSDINTVRKAFAFFNENNVSSDQLAQQLKYDFRKENCLSVNNDKEKNTYQIKLNTLEDRDNPIRAIFAVQKLNEGWDVLNLFDIVRCYETRDHDKTGKTTTSEAQLIGRGARYFPFVLPSNNDMFSRKFDSDFDHELRVLEQLHYHSINDSHYIEEISGILTEEGLMDKKLVECDIKLKPKFKKSQFYNEGIIYLNERREKDYSSMLSFKDMGIVQKIHEYSVPSEKGIETPIIGRRVAANIGNGNETIIQASEIGHSIVLEAISRHPFFRFDSLKRYFPHLDSISEFISSNSYLGGMEISFKGGSEIKASDKLTACTKLLKGIEEEIRYHHTDHIGTKEFNKKEKVKSIFTDKRLRINEGRFKHSNEIQSIIDKEDWYVFDAEYGTSEEKALVRTINRWIKKSGRRYAEIYLLRNENHFKIYNFSDGRAFQPDFVLHLKKKNGKTLNYQLFIEPKGEFLMENNRWKEEFLKEIKARSRFISGKAGRYRLIGLPFFNEEKQREFVDNLNQSLEEKKVA